MTLLEAFKVWHGSLNTSLEGLQALVKAWLEAWLETWLEACLQATKTQRKAPKA